jgi:CRP-like cAMP-binding protein
MENFKPFFQFLQKFVELSEAEFRLWVEPYLQVRHFRKKEVVSRTREVEQYLNYVTKGLVRKYYKRGKDEIITQIATEGHIIHAEESFHSRTPSEYCIETIEPSTLISISYEDLEKIYSMDPKMERIGRLVVTFTMVIKDRWQASLVRMSPRERFLHFIDRNPDLFQRVPQKYLASYLNIQPETFSRFKHMLRSR